MLKIKKVTAEGEGLQQAKALIAEYTVELDVNLSFQAIADEMKNLMTKYSPPQGALFVASYDGRPAGCVGLIPTPEAYTCEMKRMYVRPAFRQFSIGMALALRILEEAQSLGYKKMLLDTLERLQPAIALYKKLGFTVTTAYYDNPLQGVVYMERQL